MFLSKKSNTYTLSLSRANERPSWPKRIVDPARENVFAIYESGTRLATRTYFGVAKGILLNMFISYYLNGSLVESLAFATLSALGSAPKIIIGSSIETLWNRCQWGIRKDADGKKETLLRISLRNASRKLASTGVDTAYFLATSGSILHLNNFFGTRFAATFAIDLAVDNGWNHIKWGTIVTNRHSSDPVLAREFVRPRPLMRRSRHAAVFAAVSSLVLHPIALPDTFIPNRPERARERSAPSFILQPHAAA